MGNPRLDPNLPVLSTVDKTDDSSETELPSPSDTVEVLAFLSQEVIACMGKEFLAKTPLDLMERYGVATVDSNDPTGQMLRDLTTNFMNAYSSPETREEALKALDFLAYLSEK